MFTFRKVACSAKTLSNMLPDLWLGAWPCVTKGAIVGGLSMACRMEALEVASIKPAIVNCKAPESLTVIAMENGIISTFTRNVITILKKDV